MSDSEGASRRARFVSPSLAERLATDLATGRSTAPHEALSDREYECSACSARAAP